MSIGWTGAVGVLAASVAAAQPCTTGGAPGFVTPPGFTSEIRDIAYFEESGTHVLYATGSVLASADPTLRGIARWYGDRWEPVGQGGMSSGSLDLGVSLVVADLGGGAALFLGGHFNQVGGVTASNVARWDGTTWSPLGLGTNDTVRDLVVYDDGADDSLYAVGLFTAAGGAAAQGIARWDGAAWSPVGEGLQGEGKGYAAEVLDLGDGPKLYIGGAFTKQTGSGPVVSNIAAWDGDAWSGLGEGVFPGSTPNTPSFVLAIHSFDYGQGAQLTVAGRFSMTSEAAQAARVARWTGSKWMQVGPDLGRAPTHYATSLAVCNQPQGPALYVGGTFTQASWLNNVNYIARLGDSTWVGVEGGMENWVRRLVVHHEPSGDRLIAAGAFTTAGASVVDHIAEWDGSTWSPVLNRGRGLSGFLDAAAVFGGGAGEHLYVGGELTRAGTRVVSNIASWDGSEWSNVGGGLSAGTAPLNTQVCALAVLDDGGGENLYATGNFSLAGNGPCRNVARWDGTQWASLGGSGPDGLGLCLAAHGSGAARAIYVGGKFQTAGGAPARGIAAWDGVQWSGVGGGLTSPLNAFYVSALASFDDGDGSLLYAGGYFLEMGGVIGMSGLACWDGAEWRKSGDFRFGVGASPGAIHTLAVLSDGLYAGGRFDWVWGVPASNIARQSGADWSPVGPGQPYAPATTGGTGSGVRSIAETRDGVWVTGLISSTGPAGTSAGLTRWRRGEWSGLAPSPLGSDPVGRAVVPWSRGGRDSVFIAGTFASVAGMPTTNIAEYLLCPCPADCDNNGLLTLADFGCFQTRFALGDPYADCNGDSLFNLSDFGCFQTKFALGCP